MHRGEKLQLLMIIRNKYVFHIPPKTSDTKLPLVLSRGSANFPMLFEIVWHDELASNQVEVEELQ